MRTKTPQSSGELTFNDFKRMAADQSLSTFEKIGFPDGYRAGKEEAIFRDIQAKLPNLQKTGGVVLEIGPGCSGPALMMVEQCRRQEHQLVLVDSDEMLRHVPAESFITKVAGRFPDECAAALEPLRGRVDVIVCYSVLHYIYAETNLFDFFDKALILLGDGGQMLVGDIPNVSKRRRFFSSPEGIRFHQEFTGRDEIPEVRFNTVEPGKIDDSVLLGLVARIRQAGADAYLMPQPADLPMANRREDLLVVKP